MKKIALLGSTGSIGRQVLNCVDRHGDKFEIVSLAAFSNSKLLGEQVNKYRPRVAALTNSEAAAGIGSLPKETRLYLGDKALIHAVTDDADVVFVAVVGFVGLQAVIEAIKADKTVALANKEALVAGGAIVMELLKKHPKAKILPVDSEHSAIWQSLGFDFSRPFKRLILTASGGAFLNKSAEELEHVTAADALKHPNWQMGNKITVDCATMLNKGLEVIEASWLFDAPLDKIDVVIHPESVIHSMVEFEDGAIVCEMAYPSMEIPIQLALSYPERLKTDVKSYDFLSKPLTFREIDSEKYPCFSIALESARLGNNYPCAMSAANEAAVGLFLQDKIPYKSISKYILHALDGVRGQKATLESLTETDRAARFSVMDAFQKGGLY